MRVREREGEGERERERERGREGGKGGVMERGEVLFTVYHPIFLLLQSAVS